MGEEITKKVSPRVSLVVPAAGELEGLRNRIEDLPGWLQEVIVVANREPAGMAAALEGCVPNTVILAPSNGGGAGSLAHGIWAATGDIIVVLGARCPIEASAITSLTNAILLGADFAKACHSEAFHGPDAAKPRYMRRAVDHSLALLVNLAYGVEFSGIRCGCLAFSASCREVMDLEVWSRLPKETWYSGDGVLQAEQLINLRVARAEMEIAEVAVQEVGGSAEPSTLKTLVNGIQAIRAVVRDRKRPSWVEVPSVMDDPRVERGAFSREINDAAQAR